MDNIFRGLLATLFCSIGIFFLVPLFTASSSDVSSSTVIASDRLTQPPVRQTVENNGYRLEIAAIDDWQTPVAIAQLTKDGDLLWKKELPHHYGPRFFFVSPSGKVVLFDEFINVASDYAIALFDLTGETVTQYSFDDIQQMLPGVSRADLTRQASSGWWISEAPMLSEPGDYAQVEAGGLTLQLDLATGELAEQ